jgi:hypothetical protein
MALKILSGVKKDKRLSEGGTQAFIHFQYYQIIPDISRVIPCRVPSIFLSLIKYLSENSKGSLFYI